MIKTTVVPRLRDFALARLSPEGAFGLHLTIGIALLMLAAWIFGDIAEDVVTHDDITVVDVWLSNWFHTHKNSPWTPFMLFITHAHNTVGVLTMFVLLALWLRWKQAHYWLLTLVLAVPGGMLLNVLLKIIFQRARPSFEEPLLTLATYSFPSGHTMAATVLYGVMAAYIVWTARRWKIGIAAVAMASAMVFLVALSRVYLGAHYLSDVLAAMVEGCGWLAICITASATLRRRRAARAPSTESFPT